LQRGIIGWLWLAPYAQRRTGGYAASALYGGS